MDISGTRWDAESEGNWPRAFYETVKLSITDPVSFFGLVAQGEGIMRPWFYTMLISIIAFICSAAYQAGFSFLGFGFFDAVKKTTLPAIFLSGPFLILFLAFFIIVGMPFLITVGLLIQTSLFHLALVIMGSAKRSFAATFRTVCYCAGPHVFQIVPLLGGMVAGIWVVILNVIGIKVVHETSYARSAFAVFLPLILCCGAGILLLVMIAGGIFAALVTK